MSKVDRKLAETFGLEVEEKELPALINPPEQKEEIDDFEFVRGTLHSLIEAGTAAFEDLADIARNEEKISAFSTMNDMLSNLADISTKLLEIQKKKREIESVKTETTQQINNVTNNVAYIGSTADLAKLLNSGEIIDGEITKD